MLRFRRIASLFALSGLLLAVFGCTLLNQMPVASFTVDPTSGAAPLAVQVDASPSFDPDGDTMTYQWDFGDGTFASGMIATHTYVSEGQFTIRLTLTDVEGQASQALQTIVVSSSAEMPVANFSASPSSGGTPLTVAFNSSASNDPNGTIVSYHWSFGDGSTSNHPSPLHTYAAEGSYTASLTVTDDDGLSDTVTMIIVVVDGGQGGCQ